MIDLSALSNAATTATSLSNLLLVTPEDTGYQPQNPSSEDGEIDQQAESFLFHYEGEQTVTLTSDITDHFAEDNLTIQDQIALKPVLVTTHGYIGELNDVPPAALKYLKLASQKLSSISGYTPGLSATAINAYNNAASLYSTARNIRNNAVSTWGTISGSGGVSVVDASGNLVVKQNQNKQQEAFQKFYGYWAERRLFTVQTPWALFKNMAIQSLRAIQGEETRVITDFEVQFKQMRFAETLNLNVTGQSTYDYSKFTGRAFTQGSPLVDLGTSTPVSAESLSSVIP